MRIILYVFFYRVIKEKYSIVFLDCYQSKKLDCAVTI